MRGIMDFIQLGMVYFWEKLKLSKSEKKSITID